VVLDRRQRSCAQQLGELPGIDILVAGFQQGVPPWIAHHDFRDVRLHAETERTNAEGAVTQL